MFKFNFIKNSKTTEVIDFFDYLLSQKQKQQSIYHKSLEKAVDIIASYISKIKLDIYKYDLNTKKFKEDDGELRYVMNVRPNANENSTNFKYNVIHKYLTEGEALIIEINNKLYLVDDFVYTNNIISENTYSNIKLKLPNGNILSINKTFKANDVIHLKVTSKKIQKFLQSFYADYGPLIETARKQYIISNSSKYFMKIPGSQPAIYDTIAKKEISYDEYKSKILNSLFDENDGAVLLSEKVNVTKVDNGERKSSNDYIQLLDKWSNEVAAVFDIPQDIFNKTKTEKSSSDEDFISYCIMPILVQIEDELNSAIFKEKAFKDGYIRFNRYSLIYHDAISNATSIDKLFSNGFTQNDIRKFLDLDRILEPWADESYVTKNYGSMKGGDNDEK